MADESYSEFAQRYNVVLGILLFAFSTSVLLSFIPFGIFFTGDLFLVIGGSIGLYFTFKYRKESQSHVKTGIIVGLIGSVLSLILIGLFDWIIYFIPLYGLGLIPLLNYLLYLFIYYGIIYAIVGLLIGYLFGNSNRKRDTLKQL